MATEVAEAAALGLRSVVDAMPCDAGRNVAKLADLSKRTGVQVVAPDRAASRPLLRPGALEPPGLRRGARRPVHGGRHRRHRCLRLRRAGRAPDHVPCRASSRSRGPRAGCRPATGACSRPPPRPHRRTGVPILTHCEHGTGALEQIRVLRDHGVAARHIVLSHVDKVVDRGYHRELLATGAYGEYDGSFRWKDDEPNGTAPAHPLDGRGRARRTDRPRDGRRPASLLQGPRRWTRARLAARRLHPDPGRRPGWTSRYVTACS